MLKTGLYHVERNHYWAAFKNLPPGQLALLPLHTLQRYFWQGLSVLTGGGSGGEFLTHSSKATLIKALLKGTLDAMSGLSKALSKRKAAKRNRRLTNAQMATLLKKYSLSYQELFDNAS